MISMELSDGAVLWQRDIGYIYRDAWVDEKLILETNLEKSRRIDPETGTDLREKKIRLYALPDDWSGAEPKVGLGYAQSMWTTGKEARGFDFGGRFDALETSAQFQAQMERLHNG